VAQGPTGLRQSRMHGYGAPPGAPRREHAPALHGAPRAQRLVQDSLALEMLEGNIKPGDTVVADADAKKQTIVLKKETVKAARKSR
jgi:hypothetical protein